MLKRYSAWLRRVSSGWVALVALVVFVLFLALVLPRQAAQAEGAAGGAGSPDTSFWYTPADLYRQAEAYGPEGRQAYIRARWTFDLVWPVVYTAFLVTAISWVYRRTFAPHSRWQWANLAPVLGVSLDYMENMAASLVMARYPAPTPVVAGLAPVFTSLKWVFVGGSFVLLLLGVVVGAWRWRKRSDGDKRGD